MADRDSDPLRGLSDEDRRVMERLLRAPPEQQKAVPKPTGERAEAQRRRRQKEREAASEASRGA
jgi:hypothetical protein